MKRLFTCFLALGFLPANADAPGSQDSELLNRYIGSTIINYGSISGSYDFIYASVDKIKRDVSFESSVRVTGTGVRITYEMPRGVSRDDAAQWFTDQLDELKATLLFKCDGPDCGRATIWASQVFRLRDLSAPDREQSYAAYVLNSESSQELVALYVVERGNKRVIAHIELVRSNDVVDFDENRGFADVLTATGFAVINDVEPSRDGSFDSTEVSVIASIAGMMSSIVARDIYVVCHIHAAGSAEKLIESSQKCAETVSEQLAEVSSVKSMSMGVGPLFPSEGQKQSRVEVVIPSLMRRVSR